MTNYLIGNLSAIICISLGYLFGKPWLDKRINKPTSRIWPTEKIKSHEEK